MKTFAHFDVDGKIRGLVTIDAPEGVDAGVVPEPGVFVDEVEGVDLNPKELDIESVGEILERYKVAPATHEPRKLIEADR